ncbi:hypothetical protein, variant [Saprolegnia diclina VS20]|uniref:Kinesin-like protein n=1 Tax=Saprolegnia diclina (strain VS20) TaxID=1156394 RepID=T0SI75_SAPDV|nr:hypothetical protein, variant [Saprolegnia diclina VS20]EQC42532.1 hypothetical protein, variant [Saprolegnia diclina VS20]|eukprot:XP_008603955.1 hypothetical protein, variant [Saprolegnia diclina VS20]
MQGGAQTVQVSCRFRGGNDDASAVGLEFPGPTTVVLPSMKGTQFSFDRVFPPETTQDTIFEHIGAPVIDELLSGYNCTILAYGQTGSGKTHTILGSKTEKGILPRLVQRTFEAIAARPNDATTEVSTGLFEVYQEKIQDLLNPSNAHLRIREDKLERGIWVQGAADIVVSDPPSALRLVQKGLAGRSMGAHLMNAESSRSHCIFMLTVTQRFSSGLKQTGKLYLVDLAGSEMVRKTAASGKRLDEAKHINKSLTALGLVINALTDGRSKHIPYRDSKLTRLLQNSLGGNAKTHLILTCSSSATNLEETLSTIRFGARAQHVTNSPQVNTERTISEYKQLLQTLELKVAALSVYVASLESKTTVCPRCSCSNSATNPPPMARATSDTNLRSTCHVCGSSDPELVLCDGNCGRFWHPSCLPSASNNPLECICPDCADDAYSLQDELSALKRALQTIKADRDELEERASVQKQVLDVADHHNSSLHRALEERVVGQELRIQVLSNQLEAASLQYASAQRDMDALRTSVTKSSEVHQRNADAAQAEIDIVRRSLVLAEKENAALKDQAHDLALRAAQSEKRARECQDQLDACRLLLVQRDDEAARRHSVSTSPIKVALSPGKIRPATAIDILNDARLSLQSRGNIQQWWSGSDGPPEHAWEPKTNNVAEDSGSGDGPARPFKARLVGLLTSLQEETDAFKDLGDKIAEQAKPKLRKGRHRSRLPAMDDPPLGEAVLY